MDLKKDIDIHLSKLKADRSKLANLTFNIRLDDDLMLEIKKHINESICILTNYVVVENSTYFKEHESEFFKLLKEYEDEEKQLALKNGS